LVFKVPTYFIKPTSGEWSVLACRPLFLSIDPLSNSAGNNTATKKINRKSIAKHKKKSKH
jgi:hypothetical protein